MQISIVIFQKGKMISIYIHLYLHTHRNAGWGKRRFTVEYMKQFIFVLLFVNYCIIFHTNNYKPTFAPPYV